MDIALGPEIEEILLRKVDAGEYPSVATLVEEALFLLIQRDWQKSREELALRMGGDLFPAADPNAEPGRVAKPHDGP